MVNKVATSSDIERWLEWGSRRLIAMPTKGLYPAHSRSCWPEFDTELNRFEALYRRQFKPRLPIPSSKDITVMDEIQTLLLLCKDIKARRIVGLRTLVHPRNDRHIYTWAKIARRLRESPYQVQKLYYRGLLEIANKTPAETVCRISAHLEIPLAFPPPP